MAARNSNLEDRSNKSWPYLNCWLILVYFVSCVVFISNPKFCFRSENDDLRNVTESKTLLSLDLPYYAKYFLIAAFLASYNAPREDKRLFVKHQDKKKKRLVQNKKKENTTNDLLGPKTFTLDRLLAIFYAIMEEKASLTANLLAQVSSYFFKNYIVEAKITFSFITENWLNTNVSPSNT